MCHVEIELDRERLGRQVALRRSHLGLSISAAARIAQIDRGTWTGVEKAARETEEYNHAGIERALQWAPGSIAATLAGGDPTPQRADQPEAIERTLPEDFDLQAEIERISRLNIPARTKLALARQITDLYEQAQAEDRQ